MTKTINASAALLAVQAREQSENKMPAFLARKPGDAPPNRPMTAPKVPTLKSGGKKLLADHVNSGAGEGITLPPKGGKKAAAVVTVKVAPAVAEGAYKNGREAEDRTGITAKRRAAGVKAPKVTKAAKSKTADKEAKPAAAGEFMVGPHAFKGKSALLMQAVSRKAGVTVTVGGVKLTGPEKGATMKQLLKATGWAACRSTLGKLCRDARRKLQQDDAKGEDARFWID